MTHFTSVHIAKRNKIMEHNMNFYYNLGDDIDLTDKNNEHETPGVLITNFQLYLQYVGLFLKNYSQRATFILNKCCWK